MTAEAHIIAWNRQDTIEFTIKHYQQFCERVIIYDNHSDDLTREIAAELGAIVKTFGNPGVLDDQEYLKVKNEAWKASQADWVIVVDDDEILYHPNLVSELQLATDSGATIIRPAGFSMFSDYMPLYDWIEIKTGVRDEKYDKLCCFNPKRISDINYVPGCHEARPKGSVRLVNKAYMLHYHGVGGVQRMIDRHQQYEPRRQRSAFNMRWGCGKEYGYSPESKREWFEEQLKRSEVLQGDGMPF